MSSTNRLPALLRLLRWLGPWTAESTVPPGIDREVWCLREGELRGKRGYDAAAERGEPFTPVLGPGRVARLDALVYLPRAPIALVIVSPGLHFDGPDDPRLDRFCRVLASAGHVVVAPYLPSYADMRVEPAAVDDLEACTRAAMTRFSALGPPTLFSISFGSWPALEVAARLGDAVDSVITFGGYAEFGHVASFNLDGLMHAHDGPTRLPYDVLNPPAVFVNIIRFLRPGEDNVALERAWRRLCYATWGRMDLKEPGRLIPFVDELERTLSTADRALFRTGAGVDGDSVGLLRHALDVGREELSGLDPAKAITRLTCPVVVCHGRDDDVIPWGEAVKLAEACRHYVPTALHLTGLYAHTGHGTPRPAELAGEVRTMLQMARAIANAGRLRAVMATGVAK